MHAEPINTHNLDLITIINRAKYIIIVLFRTVIGTMTINLKLLQRLNGNWSIELIVFSLDVFCCLCPGISFSPFLSLSLSLFIALTTIARSREIIRSSVYRSLDIGGRRFHGSGASWAVGLSHFINYYLINYVLNYYYCMDFEPTVSRWWLGCGRLNLVECDCLRILKQLLIPISQHECEHRTR